MSNSSLYLTWAKSKLKTCYTLFSDVSVIVIVVNAFVFVAITAHSREFVCTFCFVSCETSHKVNISQLLT